MNAELCGALLLVVRISIGCSLHVFEALTKDVFNRERDEVGHRITPRILRVM